MEPDELDKWKAELIAAIETAIEAAVARALGQRRRQHHAQLTDPLTWPDEKLLTRAEASFYADATGHPLSKWLLDKLAVSGGGPPIEYFGTKPLYRVGDLRAWLASRTRRARSTAELRRLLETNPRGSSATNLGEPQAKSPPRRGGARAL